MTVGRHNRRQMADSEDQDVADDTLIARMAAGERDALAALYRRRRPDVYRFALLMSGSPAVADDVVQDVFMELIRHADRYQPDRSGIRGTGAPGSRVVPWLLGIARNHVLRSRHRQRFSTSMEDAEGAPALVVSTDPLAGMARRQHLEALRRALLALPVKYRETIVLCDLHDMSYADAAASLGCAIGTVRSRLHRGRAMLASRLSERDSPPLRSPIARWLL
jgi:RNA polymerase sigma-70 factor (ECF subfamily)